MFLSSLRARMPKSESCKKFFFVCKFLDTLMMQSNYNMGGTNISNSFYDCLSHSTKCRWEPLNVDERWWKFELYSQADWKMLKSCWESVTRTRMRRMWKGIWNLVDQQKGIRVDQTEEACGPRAIWGMRKKETTFRRVKMKVCNHHRALASKDMYPKIRSKLHRHSSVTPVLPYRILKLSNISKFIVYR